MSLSDETKRKIGAANKIHAKERWKLFPEKFWGKVNKTESCWIWTGTIKPDGYGSIFHQRKAIAAHRMAWILSHGEIPLGLFVCHHCDVRQCVNPEHLFIGTQQDNIRDASAKGRLVTGDRHHMRSDQEVRERVFSKQRGVSVPSRAKYGPRPEWIRERMRIGKAEALKRRQPGGR